MRQEAYLITPGKSDDLQIVAYTSAYQSAFKSLNERWINEYFEMEETDQRMLEEPEKYILDKGGHILVALERDKPVGVCALVVKNEKGYDYELAKMAVDPSAQGKGIGKILGQAIIEKAKSLGAKKIFLVSNSKLEPAISLYKKLGFTEIEHKDGLYKRCNVQMEKVIINE
ncbi:GNAT family N-acetyltransferase [Roseivirga sp. BDSF3-8]|uniref:GNAT family N-acetyltransferase n=1 Tax=Roseivirga sp. BDSF3-8 TaxID=3241598 RepID=UPI003531D3CA